MINAKYLYPALDTDSAATAGTHVSVEAVGHELKLSIGRDEGDGPVVLET